MMATKTSRKMADNGFSLGEARKIAKVLGIDWSDEKFDVASLARGMNVELEHAGVTKKDAKKTAQIAIDHLREKPNYYALLERYVEKAMKGPIRMIGKCDCDEKMIGKCGPDMDCPCNKKKGKTRLPMIGKADEMLDSQLPDAVRVMMSQLPLEMQATELGGAGSTDIRPSMREMNYEVPSRHAGMCSTCDHAVRTVVNHPSGVQSVALECTALAGRPGVSPSGHCDLWTGSDHILIGKQAGGPFIGPRGGKWADPEHTIPYKDEEPKRVRTGVIPVDDKAVRAAVEELIGDLPVDGDGWISKDALEEREREAYTHVQFAGNGSGSTMRVSMMTSHSVTDERGVAGRYVTAREGSRHTRPSYRSITLVVGIRAWNKAVLARNMRSVLSHEMTHASDPGLYLHEPVKSPASQAEYLNQPHEVTASLQQIRRDLQNPDAYAAARRGRVKPIDWLEMFSERWGHVGHHFTEKNKRRVYKMVAAVYNGIRENQLPMVGKASNGAGPQPEYGQRQSMPDYQAIYNVLSDEATQKKTQEEIIERRRASSLRNDGKFGFHGEPPTPVLRNREGAWSSQPARTPEKMSTQPIILPPRIFKMNPKEARDRLKKRAQRLFARRGEEQS